jgi:hypothetical protein
MKLFRDSGHYVSRKVDYNRGNKYKQCRTVEKRYLLYDLENKNIFWHKFILASWKKNQTLDRNKNKYQKVRNYFMKK